MTAIVRILNRAFTPIDEFTSVELEERSWLINGVGAFSFRLGLADPKNNYVTLRAGNLVRVESDLGVPPWVGRIDELDWSDPESIKAICNSREVLAKGQYGENVTSTDLLASLINKGNNPDEFGIRRIDGVTVGDIYSATLPGGTGGGGSGKKGEANGGLAGDVISIAKNLCDQLDAEFAVEHATGKFNLQPQLGKDKTADVWIEQSDIVASPGFRLNTTNLISYAYAIPPYKAGKLGPRQSWLDPDLNTFLSGDVRTKIIHTTATAAAVMLAECKKVIQKSIKGLFTLDLSIHNERGIMSKFFIGDTIGVRVSTFAWGMVKQWRVKGFAIVDENSPQVRLILEPQNQRDLLTLFGPH